jgi:hypothetical protein
MAAPTLDISKLLGVTIDETLGCILIGFGTSCVVFGILCMQCISYFSRYPLDKTAYKLLVCLSTSPLVFPRKTNKYLP